MSWDDFEKKMKGGAFISLKEGQDITGVFRGEPVVFYSMYDENSKTSVKKPEYFEINGKAAAPRFSINFVVKDTDGNLVAKIFENSKTTAVTLKECKKEYGLDCLFKIKRVGAGKETKYPILFKDRLNKEQLAALEGVKLHDLTVTEKGEDPVYDEFPTSAEDLRKRTTDDIPF